MADNAQKLWAGRSLHRIGDTRSNDRQERQNKAIPCTVTKVTNATVTVSLELKTDSVTLPTITIPQAYSEWARTPTQVGDKGWAVPADYYMGGQSGLGGGAADLYQRSNLTNLVFHHVSQTSFSPWDGTKHFLNGPNGVVLATKDGSVSIDIDKQSGAVTIKGDLKVTGNITAGSGTTGSVEMQNHTHQNVQPGAGTSGPPVPLS